ncbi:MAG: sel1 repeat family protein [Alphaproteobacteria bacterium]|nr:sel1 repeat family protein [Alphaproteobacteria bacterium]MBV9693589.1 sel1 repeat family protein [Alphaproteobacteria bacterium]
MKAAEAGDTHAAQEAVHRVEASAVTNIGWAAGIAIFACLAQSAQAQDMRATLPNSEVDRDGTDLKALEPKKLPSDPVGVAAELRLRGRCDRAVPILRNYAERDNGGEIAQFNLGMCLIDLAGPEHDAKRAGELKAEGAQWILRAANAGMGKAQAEAVLLYLDGVGVAADPVEADKWALLFHDNGTRIAIGLSDLSSSVKDRLDAALSAAQRSQARARADAWVSTAPSQDNE